MPWTEFCSYLVGIMPDTPLGNFVQIRSEHDKKVIKNFTKEQRKIRNDWLMRNTKKVDTSSKEYKDMLEGFKNMFKSLAGGEAKGE